MPRDPSSEKIETHGERVEKHRVGYAGAGGAVLGSGRVTAFETRLISGVRFNPTGPNEGYVKIWSEELVSLGSGSSH